MTVRHVAVRHVLTLKSVSLHATRKAFAFTGTRDGDFLTIGEDLTAGDFLTSREPARVLNTEFAKLLYIGSKSRFLQVAELGKGEVLIATFAKPHLDSVVAVTIVRLDLRDPNRPGLNDRDRDHAPVCVVDVRHAHFGSEDAR